MYKSIITESSKELTAKERIALKDFGNAVQIDTACPDGANLTITPVAYAVVHVENDKSDTGEYDKFVVLDKDGTKYVTGSDSFYRAFREIWDEMIGEEEYSLEVYKRPSQNYKGKSFISCSIV